MFRLVTGLSCALSCHIGDPSVHSSEPDTTGPGRQGMNVVVIGACRDLKGCDISVVTSRHLYVEGMFNTTTKDGQGGSWFNDSLSISDVPSALLAGDTITALSKNWEQHYYDPLLTKKTLGATIGNKGDGFPITVDFIWDRESALKEIDQQNSAHNKSHNLDWLLYHARSGTWSGTATPTWYNAVFMLGIMPSLTPTESEEQWGFYNVHHDNHYSGGLENVFRWIEYWKNSVEMGFRGSILCLYSQREPEYRWRMHSSSSAVDGVSQLHNTSRMSDPVRNWAFGRMSPPGLPHFYGAQEAEWARVPWSSVWDD